jgi:hypothetical protein
MKRSAVLVLVFPLGCVVCGPPQYKRNGDLTTATAIRASYRAARRGVALIVIKATDDDDPMPHR